MFHAKAQRRKEEWVDMSATPLSGLRVVEFTHMIMGPSIGAILSGLGAEVIHVEPIGGDKTRTLIGSGAGFFATFNRGKSSICLNLKSKGGIDVAKKLIDSADIMVENYRPGAIDSLGLDYLSLAATNPRLIYCSAKGFLPGPYEDRTALDEVAQMMGGLAYMTGPPGQPLRAGAKLDRQTQPPPDAAARRAGRTGENSEIRDI